MAGLFVLSLILAYLNHHRFCQSFVSSGQVKLPFKCPIFIDQKVILRKLAFLTTLAVKNYLSKPSDLTNSVLTHSQIWFATKSQELLGLPITASSFLLHWITSTNADGKFLLMFQMGLLITSFWEGILCICLSSTVLILLYADEIIYFKSANVCKTTDNFPVWFCLKYQSWELSRWTK